MTNTTTTTTVRLKGDEADAVFIVLDTFGHGWELEQWKNAKTFITGSEAIVEVELPTEQIRDILQIMVMFRNSKSLGPAEREWVEEAITAFSIFLR